MAKITLMKYISWSEREKYSTEHNARGRGGYPGGQTLSLLVAYHDLILLDDNLFIA